ncbi:hypothetical protein OB905_06625 [Halobacteria archaeon AArc-dxtr1]|nr:hypothetical protein [Halobacteria archaeon AArc-dxtr1]
MGYREDAINAVRRSLLPQIHFLLRGTFDGYAVSHTSAEEYVLTAECSEDELEAALEEMGFSRNPIAALKVRMDGNTAEGSWVWRASPLASKQLHIVLHDLENETGVDVYAHWECSWIRHPYKHYVARGYDAETGVDLTRQWFDRYAGEVVDGQGIEYEIDTSAKRRLSEYLSLSYYQTTEWAASIRSRLPLVDGGDESAIPIGGDESGPLSSADDESAGDEGGRNSVSPRVTDKI